MWSATTDVCANCRPTPQLPYRFFLLVLVRLVAEGFPVSRLSDLMAACIAASAAAVAAWVAAFTAILCMRAALDFAAPMMDGFRADLFFFLFFAIDKLLFRHNGGQFLNSSHEDQDQKNHDHQPETAPSVVAGSIKRSATPATKAAKQE
jgi:hypothetical protein